MRGGLSRAPFLFSVAGEARSNARGRSPPLLFLLPVPFPRSECDFLGLCGSKPVPLLSLLNKRLEERLAVFLMFHKMLLFVDKMTFQQA